MKKRNPGFSERAKISAERKMYSAKKTVPDVAAQILDAKNDYSGISSKKRNNARSREPP